MPKWIELLCVVRVTSTIDGGPDRPTETDIPTLTPQRGVGLKNVCLAVTYLQLLN